MFQMLCYIYILHNVQILGVCKMKSAFISLKSILFMLILNFVLIRVVFTVFLLVQKLYYMKWINSSVLLCVMLGSSTGSFSISYSGKLIIAFILQRLFGSETMLQFMSYKSIYETAFSGEIKITKMLAFINLLLLLSSSEYILFTQDGKWLLSIFNNPQF